ncbi:HIT family protein [archaeon]|nr:HIT family protein [archaeon]
MKDCIFCKIVNKEIPSKIIYEDEHALAFLDIEPVNVGHTLVVPKKHFETIDKMDKEEYDKLSEAILKISKGIMCLADGLNVMQNNKEIAGQAVPHVHFHLIPRYNDDGYRFDWKKDEDVTEKENNEFLEKIKSFLK